MNSIMHKAVAESRKPSDEFGKPRFFKSVSNYFRFKKAHAQGNLDLPQRLELAKPTFVPQMIKSPKTRTTSETLYEQIPRTLRAAYLDGSKNRVVLEKGVHPALLRVWVDTVNVKYLYKKFFKLKVKIDEHSEKAEKADEGTFGKIRQFWNIFWMQKHEAGLLLRDFKMRKKTRIMSNRYNIENTESNLRIFALRHAPRLDSVEVHPHSVVVRSLSIEKLIVDTASRIPIPAATFLLSYFLIFPGSTPISIGLALAISTIPTLRRFAGSLWNAAALKKEINFSTAPAPDKEDEIKMNKLLLEGGLFSVGKYSKKFPLKPLTLGKGELTYDSIYDKINVNLTNEILKIERKL